MIVGIGIDLVEHSRFSDWATSKKQTIFTPEELAYAKENKSDTETCLANFWAARGATIKALGTNFKDGIKYSDISVIFNGQNQPELMFTGGAQAALKQLTKGKRINLRLSITDQTDYSTAVVFIETVQ